MTSRLLGIALTTVLGVSIGIATFDGEFKEQRRKRLQAEYDREVAAAAALTNQSLAPTTSTIASPSPPQMPAERKVEKDSTSPEAAAETKPSWSSMLGLWAWEKNSRK